MPPNMQGSFDPIYGLGGPSNRGMPQTAKQKASGGPQKKDGDKDTAPDEDVQTRVGPKLDPTDPRILHSAMPTPKWQIKPKGMPKIEPSSKYLNAVDAGGRMTFGKLWLGEQHIEGISQTEPSPWWQKLSESVFSLVSDVMTPKEFVAFAAKYHTRPQNPWKLHEINAFSSAADAYWREHSSYWSPTQQALWQVEQAKKLAVAQGAKPAGNQAPQGGQAQGEQTQVAKDKGADQAQVTGESGKGADQAQATGESGKGADQTQTPAAQATAVAPLAYGGGGGGGGPMWGTPAPAPSKIPTPVTSQIVPETTSVLPWLAVAGAAVFFVYRKWGSR